MNLTIFRYANILSIVIFVDCFFLRPQAGITSDYTIEHAKANIVASHERLRLQGKQYQDDQTAEVYKLIDGVEKIDTSIYTRRRTRQDGYFISEMTMKKADNLRNEKFSPPDRATGYTPKYDFELRANRSTEWFINRCVVVDSPEYNDSDRKNHQESLNVSPFDSHYRNVLNIPLSTFFANENVKITSFDKSPSNAGCYRLTYTASGDNLMPGAKIALTMSGWIDIHPELNWSAVEMVGTTKLPTGDATTSHKFTTKRINDVVLVVRHEQKTDSKVGDKVIQTRIVTELNPRFSSDVSPSEFLLTHYNLPEPVGVEPPPSKSTPLAIWFLVAAGVLAVVAMSCRWLLRRRTRASVALPATK